MGQDIHELKINKLDSLFSYEYLNNLYGKVNGVIHGTYTKKNDSLFLKIIYPIEYKIKNSFVAYTNYKSSDSIYFFFYSLYPEITKINQHLYRNVSISLIENCMTDTCSSYESVESSYFPFSLSGEKITVPRNYYKSVKQDTLRLFDPNQDPIYKEIPIRIDTFNCIKIYLARKPNYDFIEIPLRYRIENKKLYFKDNDGKTRYFIKTK